NALWFNGNTGTQGNQLFKLGFDGSVTKWTAINPAGGGLFVDQDPDMTTFNNALWFDGFTGADFQLYNSGSDGSVTSWTTINPGGSSFIPYTLLFRSNAVWFNGNTGTQGNQLFKLGFDGSVTKWTAINPAGGGLNPQNMFEFANALWFDGQTASGGATVQVGRGWQRHPVDECARRL